MNSSYIVRSGFPSAGVEGYMYLKAVANPVVIWHLVRKSCLHICSLIFFTC